MLFSVHRACTRSGTQVGAAGQLSKPNSVSQSPLPSPCSTITSWTRVIADRNGLPVGPGSASLQTSEQYME